MAVELHGIHFVEGFGHGVLAAVAVSVLAFHEHGLKFVFLLGGELFHDLFAVVDAVVGLVIYMVFLVLYY